MLPSTDIQPRLPAMSNEALANVHRLEDFLGREPQTHLVTHHVLHGGMYARTVLLPAGDAMTGALIKIPTLLILDGHVSVYTGEGTLDLKGRHVLPGSAGRKQAFVAYEDTEMTMVFPTTATTVEEAEAEFTDDAPRLLSRQPDQTNIFVITGE